MDSPDQQILYAIRDEIAQHQLGMNSAGLNLGTGTALLDSGRLQWQTDPNSEVTLTATQLAAALAAAKHQGMQDAYQAAQDSMARPESRPAPQAVRSEGTATGPTNDGQTLRFDRPT